MSGGDAPHAPAHSVWMEKRPKAHRRASHAAWRCGRGRQLQGCASERGNPEPSARAGAVRVRVIGTRFTVRRHATRAGATTGEGVEVDVRRGTVEVEHAGTTRVLDAGNRWSTRSALTRTSDARESIEVSAPLPLPEAGRMATPACSSSNATPALSP